MTSFTALCGCVHFLSNTCEAAPFRQKPGFDTGFAKLTLRSAQMYFRMVLHTSRLGLQIKGMKMDSALFRSAVALPPATALLLSTFPALAAAGLSASDAAPEPSALDEIVVTAQKREQ